MPGGYCGNSEVGTGGVGVGGGISGRPLQLWRQLAFAW